MNRTAIDWCRNPPDNLKQGYTLNPTGGCSGKGCAVYGVCYARRTAKRFKQRCRLCYEFKPHTHFERMSQLEKHKKPVGVFIGSMSDLFDACFGWGEIAPILNLLWEYPQHRFYICTKQPQNAKNYPEYPDNVWVGVTVNRRSDLWRLDELRRVNARIKFVSFEPLQEDLGDINLDGVDWIIIGAQTRPEVQPKLDWVNNVIEATKTRQIPVFCKNNLRPILDGEEQKHLFSTWQEFPKI